MITPDERVAVHLSDEAFDAYLATATISGVPGGATIRRGGFALYRYYDYEDQLLYVGISSALATRISDHIASSRWMQFAGRSTIRRYGTLQEVREAELAAIKTERPIFNKMHNDTVEATERRYAYLHNAAH